MDLEYVVDDLIATIRLNRPERKNSFTYDMVDRWAEMLHEANRDPKVRCVVLTGTEDSFCAGSDLQARNEVGDTPLARMEALTKRVHQVARAVTALDKPLLGAINGVAVGAGMDMALMCDIRWAADTAWMSQGYIHVGLLPGDGGCFLLPRLVGTARALELMWTGDRVSAQDALAMGIVTKVSPRDQLMDDVYEFAARLAAAPPLSIAAIKQLTYRSLDVDLHTSLGMVASYMAVIQTTEDSKEAMAAFREKRPGHYTGT